jgi:NADH-quinone oxidoreductase subunit G
MVTIYIDKKPYEAKEGKNLLETCLTLGLNLPYFCWHPAMGSVGACRQCAVRLFRDENDTQGRLVMACMEAVRENMFVSVDDPVARDFRAQNIEWLMTNHPHDCAVCDEGGACHLQDMTVMTGHTYRRFEFKKRTYKNQYLGPFVNHEMNRCIQCYRCVRFYKDYAGGKDLDVFAAHDHVYFGREKDGILENEFSGNLVEICPTGVFTDKTLKEHYTRKWDMTTAPSICPHCSLGCNTLAAERYGEIRQITSRFNSEVNGYFICDRGRFGYGFVNSGNRVSEPLIRGANAGKKTLYGLLNAILLHHKVIGIGSPRASLEANFALRQLVGKEHFYQGIPEEEARLVDLVFTILDAGQVHTPSLKEIETADVVLILGEDVTNSAPRMALALRQAVREKPLENADQIHLPPWHDAALREFIQEEKGELFIAYPTQTKLDELARDTYYAAPDDIACFGFALAGYLNQNAPVGGKLDEDVLSRVKQIGEILQTAKRPLIVSGVSLGNEDIIRVAFNIALALSRKNEQTSLSFIVPECNSMGLGMMQAPSLKEAFEVMKSKQADTVFILENDLYRRVAKKDADDFFNACQQIIVLDHLHHATADRATVLIPAATFVESSGTWVSNEGRAQCFFQVFMPRNENIRESWRWLDEFRQFKNGTEPEDLQEPGKLMQTLVEVMPQFKGADTVAPPSGFHIHGQKIPREPHRYSGRTAMQAHISVSEPKPPEDRDSALSFTMEGYRGIPPAPLIPFFWSPGWNSVQAINKYQIEVGGPLRGGDPGKRLLGNGQVSVDAFKDSSSFGFEAKNDEMLVVALPHIFGSEELSTHAPAVASRMPGPYILIGKNDAAYFDVGVNTVLILRINGQSYELTVKIDYKMPEGLAGIPYNLPSMPGIILPAKGTLTKKT